ncbi:MAG: SAM-dependent methyltransferase [Longimicrobiales bacterium]
MLTFIGLGLYDERSVTVEGREALRAADRVFAEFYTSRLVGADVAELEAYHGVDVEVRDRAGVERDPEPILDAAEAGDAVFCTAGDTMISTTHIPIPLSHHCPPSSSPPVLKIVLAMAATPFLVWGTNSTQSTLHLWESPP